jgi:hypothetical protein
MVARTLRVVLWLACALIAAAFLFVAVRRLTGQIPLDSVEASVLEHATRIAGQQPLYVQAPSPGTPAVLPGFPLLASVLAGIFGPAYWEVRLLALLASLGVAILVLMVGRAESESWTLGAAAAGFVFAAFGIIASVPGVGRPEPLALLLALGGFAALRFTSGIWGALAAVFLIAAACFTQGFAVWFAATALLYLACEDRKRFAVFALGLVLLLGYGGYCLSEQLGPSFLQEAWDAPVLALRFEPGALLHFVGDQMLGKLGVLTLTAVLSLALPTPPWFSRGGIWMWMAIGALASGMLATQSAALGPHGPTPIAVVIALAGPLSIQRVTRHLAAWPGSSRMGGQTVVLAALALQFLMLLSSASPALLSS